MWLYIWTCLVLFNAVKSAQVKNIKLTNENTDAPKQAETIFADVIKNISRVNNVLQELINNYEQLQKIYKSQENDESDISDSEIDEIFKSKNVKEAIRTKNEDAATKKPLSEKFAATQMFWSDHEEDNENSDNDDDSKEVKETDAMKENEKKIEIIKPELQGLSATRKTTTSKPVTSSSETSGESSDSSTTEEKVQKPKGIGIKKPVKLKILNPTKPKKQKAEVIFVDTHQKMRETVNTYEKQKDIKAKPKIEPTIQFVGIPPKPKTRYSKVSHIKQVKKVVHNLMPHVGLNNTRKVKQIMYSESFSPKKIWNDIINNKPIQLEAHNEITMERLEKDNNDTGFNVRSKDGKTAIVIVTKSKKNKNEEFISSSEDDVTKKEELKANVLRHAYGDACLKLVLRKCHKACKKVSKSVCNRVKCKSEVKADFKSYAKTGCIKEFQGNGTEQKRTRNIKEVRGLSDSSKMNYRGQDESSFTDLTRGGFLAAACLPVQDHKDAPRNETVSLKTSPDQSFNILRDRFERACKKISSSKCNSACKYSYTKMCEKHKCSKRMKKTFKKTCKTQCKNAYQLYDDSDSDKDSDEDSDDSGSDEDTDDSDSSSD